MSPQKRYGLSASSLVAWQCSGSIHRRKKLAVSMHAAIPFGPSWDCFVMNFFSRFSPTKTASCRSHDCLPLFLNHGRGFFVLTRPRMRRMLFGWNVELLSRWRYRVLWHGAIFHIPREVPVPIHRRRSQPRGEVEAQRSSGSDIGNTGVWYHRSIAVSVTAASSFSFEVQGQSSPAPGLFYLSLHLRRENTFFFDA